MSLRIIFMGTPEFAVPSLDKILKAGYEIAAVITAPDKPAGRGMKLTKSAVKIYAEANQLTILQPEKLKDPEFIQALSALRADLQVVVAFRMLPEIVWNMPPMGTINLHGSLLPQYRGAAPINWAIINGEIQTGVTTFKLQHEIDTGNILLKRTIPISQDDTAGILHDKMQIIGADLLLETLKKLEDGSISEISQKSAVSEAGILRHAPKIFSKDCEIDWKNSAINIYNRIRGLSPHPGAFTYLGGKKLKIYQSEREVTQNLPANHLPGEMLTDHKNFIRFSAGDGYIYLKEIQLEGKKKMEIEEFLRGWRG